MLVEIGSVNNVPAYVKSVKAGEKLLMGFGHRVYKNYDPRAKIVKRVAYEVFDVMGRNPLIDIALECERIALEDEYFVSRRLYPNVDFYTGLIYQSMLSLIHISGPLRIQTKEFKNDRQRNKRKSRPDCRRRPRFSPHA